MNKINSFSLLVFTKFNYLLFATTPLKILRIAASVVQQKQFFEKIGGIQSTPNMNVRGRKFQFLEIDRYHSHGYFKS